MTEPDRTAECARDSSDCIHAVEQVFRILRALSERDRERVLDAAATFFNVVFFRIAAVHLRPVNRDFLGDIRIAVAETLHDFEADFNHKDFTDAVIDRLPDSFRNPSNTTEPKRGRQ